MQDSSLHGLIKTEPDPTWSTAFATKASARQPQQPFILPADFDYDTEEEEDEDDHSEETKIKRRVLPMRSSKAGKTSTVLSLVAKPKPLKIHPSVKQAVDQINRKWIDNINVHRHHNGRKLIRKVDPNDYTGPAGRCRILEHHARVLQWTRVAYDFFQKRQKEAHHSGQTVENVKHIKRRLAGTLDECMVTLQKAIETPDAPTQV
jgi:hypothetical protein